MGNIIKNGFYFINGLTLKNHNRMLQLRGDNDQNALALQHAKRLLERGEITQGHYDTIHNRATKVSEELQELINKQQRFVM